MNIQVKNINVKYPLKTVLKNVTQCFCSGKIHVLIGENGAGKTTLTKVICGDLIPDSGSIFIDEQEVYFKSPKDAIEKGIVCVHQTPLLAEGISVKENLLLGLNQYDKQQFKQLTEKWLRNVKLSSITRNLGGDERFFTALCTALLKTPKVLILDEPGALLDTNQRDFLFDNLRQFTLSGMTVIIITHNMEEARKYGDTVTFLQDGEIKPVDESFLNRQETITLETSSPQETAKQIKFENLNSRPIDKPAIFDVSFTAKAGELTLVCGTTESGRETLEDLICGMTPQGSGNYFSGYIELQNNNQKIHLIIKPNSFSRYKMEKKGIKTGIIPSNKNYRGSNPNLTVLQLLTGCLKGNNEQLKEYCKAIIQKAGINIQPNEKASCLSGGMLQRLILEREISKNPEVIILCEPLQGLDILSAEKLCHQLIELASTNNSIILILSSSEFPKEICNTVYNLNSGSCTLESCKRGRRMA